MYYNITFTSAWHTNIRIPYQHAIANAIKETGFKKITPHGLDTVTQRY